MNTIRYFSCAALSLLLASCGAPSADHDGQQPAKDTVAVKADTATTAAAPAPPDGDLVTPDNFCRAETDMYFGNLVKDGSIGAFSHTRELASVDTQKVVRTNRDTYYSFGIFDLDAGPLTVTLPDSKGRFLSLLAIDQDHYVVEVDYAPGVHHFERKGVGTRYLAVLLRTFGDPNDPADIAQVHALQDAVKVDQPGGPGVFETPKWDTASHKKVRDALKTMGETMSSFSGVFGARKDVDPVRHLIGTAVGWGGNPDAAAMYSGATPSRNDGTTVHTLHVDKVPVDGFWSVTVYNKEGFMVKNAQNAYSLNNITAKKNADGSIDIRFGGCDGTAPNCLPIMPGWNYTVRMYRPRKEIIDGTWMFPEAVAVQ